MAPLCGYFATRIWCLIDFRLRFPQESVSEEEGIVLLWFQIVIEAEKELL